MYTWVYTSAHRPYQWMETRRESTGPAETHGPHMTAHKATTHKHIAVHWLSDHRTDHSVERVVCATVPHSRLATRKWVAAHVNEIGQQDFL